MPVKKGKKGNKAAKSKEFNRNLEFLKKSKEICKWRGDQENLNFIEITKKKDLEMKGLFGRTYLHFAVEDDNYKAVQKLLENGFNSAKLINIKDKFGDTAMHLAVRNKNKYIILMLLLEKARCLKNKNLDGFTPIDQDLEMRKFILHVKCFESGFKILNMKYSSDNYPKIKGKIVRESLNEIFAFMDSKNLNRVDVENIRDVDRTLNNKLKDFSNIPTENLLNPVLEGEDDAEEQHLLQNEVSMYDEYMKMERDILSKHKCADKIDFILDIFCYVDRSKKEFTREEFYFAMIRQQMASMDKDLMYLSKFVQEFKKYWNRLTPNDQDSDEGFEDGEGEEGDEDDDGGDDD